MSADLAQPSQVLRGLAAAPGLAFGKAIFWEEETLTTPRYQAESPQAELDRLASARRAAGEEIAELRSRVAQEAQGNEADVFAAHLMFLEDDALLDLAGAAISVHLNAEAAWMDAIEHFAVQLESLPDPTLSARAADVRDVGLRVLRHLLGRSATTPQLSEPSIIVARDLSPSQTASLKKDQLLAFCTAEGGPTSHTAILAKALGLPAVVALGATLLNLPTGTTLMVDGNQGMVVVNPDIAAQQAFQGKMETNARRLQDAQTQATLPAITRDGHTVEVVANVGGVEDARSALSHGAEGIGLFRTEFLFLERSELPSEDEQFEAYRQVFEVMAGRPVVVRTLDIGGDKAVSYLGFTQEANPFLGWRAIRMIDERPEVFFHQIRALLRAGCSVDLRIMVPMVSNLEEIERAQGVLDQARGSLRDEGLSGADQVQFGIMVEVPSAALLADRLATHVDFFSIGTNDLTQYTLAVDRTNARVAHLASPYHPAVLALIHLTIQAAHSHGKWVGVCGELAGDVLATPLLLGMGLDEFSMAPALIPSVKQVLRRSSRAECQAIVSQALALSSTDLVLAYLQEQASRMGLQ